MEKLTVTLTLDDRRITLEGPADFVREEVERLAGSRSVSPQTAIQPDTERAFYEGKKPTNQSEAVAVFAFWLTNHGQPEFNEADIRRLYIRAGVRPPKVVAQALRDAKNKFDYIETGSKRGLFRLTDYGDRTVRFDLPRPE